jgi:transposase
METLLLKAHGLSHEQIEEIVGVTGNTIREYFDLYQQGGIVLQKSFFHQAKF